MIGLHIFKSQVGMFEPVSLQDRNVAIHYVQNPIRYRRVTFLEAIPPFQCIDLGALAANTAGARTNIPNLEMADGEFGLFRWYVIDDAQILLFLPAGVARNQLRNLQAPYDMNILTRDPNLVSSEIAVWGDNRPAIQAINGGAIALAGVRIIALGYRFHVTDIVFITVDEKKVLNQMKSEDAANQRAFKKDDQYVTQAFVEERLPVTHVWCSGRAIGD